MGVPTPTLCPYERARRRMSFAHQRHLFARTCPATEKRIVTSCPPESAFVVYDIAHWWSDKWDQHQTARDYDFSRSFFSQLAELLAVAPRPSPLRGYEFDENSDYTNHAGQNKNCYLIFDSNNCRDCLCSYSINVPIVSIVFAANALGFVMNVLIA